jgi:hypothetical protein|tara:strand:+ start:3643 stop:5340 length:1698 start_codon:yes stop_codon:yes gene_type:complete
MAKAERLFIEDDNSPTQSDIILEPKYLTYGHVRLMENINIYEYLVTYLFHEIQSNNPRMNNLDDIVYDMLNKNKFENLDINSSEIDLANPNRPYYSHDDYRKYINRFLEVIESQNLVSLIDDLKGRNILSDSSIFSDTTKSAMDDIKFRVKDLDNKSKVNKIMNYTLEPEGGKKSTLDAFLSSKPMLSSNLEKYVTVNPSGVFFDSDAYIIKMLKDANIMDRNGNLKSGKKKSLKRTEKEKVGRGTVFDPMREYETGAKESKDVTGKSGIIYAMRVEVNEDGDDEYIFYGLGEEKTFTDLEEAMSYFDSVDGISKESLDLNKPVTNAIKDSIMSFVQPENGKLKTGNLNITYKKMKLNKSDIAAIRGEDTEVVDDAKDLVEATRDRKKVLEAEESIRNKANASVSIDEQNQLIIESDEGDEDVVDIDSERDVLEDIIEVYGASFIDAAINKTPQEFFEWYKKPRQKRIVSDRTDKKPLGTKEITATRLKRTSNIFPVIRVTKMEKEYVQEYNFKVNKTFLAPQKDVGGKDVKETGTEGRYQMSDIGTINRLKATYRNLERMIDRF